MKRLCVLACLLLLVFAAPLTAQDEDAKARLEKYKRDQSAENLRSTADALLHKLRSAEPGKESIYTGMLIEMGPNVIPLLEAAQAEAPDDNIDYVIGILRLQRDGVAPVPADETGPIVYGENALAPPVIEPDDSPLPEPDDAEVRAYLDLKFRVARQQYLAGNIRYAEQLVTSLMLLEPKDVKRDEWRLFKIACGEALLQDKYVKPTVTVKKLDFDYGDTVTLLFTLKNISRQTVTIPVEPGNRRKDEAWEESGADVGIAQFELHIVEHVWDGTTRTQTLRRHFNIGEDIVLEPGKSWEKALQVDTRELWPDNLINVFRVLTVKTWLRAPYPVEEAGVEPEDLLLSRRIQFPTARCRVVPVTVAEDGTVSSFLNYVRNNPNGPMAVLRERIDSGYGEEVFLAAQLQRQSDLPAVIGLLVNTLDKPALKDYDIKRKACMAALARITGQRLQFDADKWREWWTANQSDFHPALLNPEY